MLIETIEKKIKLAIFVSVLSLIGGIIIACTGIIYGYKFALEQEDKIYIMSNDVPLVAMKSPESHLDIEGRAIIRNFHKLFFTLPPDDRYMNKSISEALYLIDESGVRQRNALQEKGFYSNILSQSSNFSILCDSIHLNPDDQSFVYYGTQRIEGRQSITLRSLVTTGYLSPIVRTESNPYGYIISQYKTISNQDISTYRK